MKTSKNHPTGLYLLSLTCVGERFSYYGMRALLSLFLISALFSKETTSLLYGSFTALVYLMPLLGAYISNRYFGNVRSILIGGLTMAVGHFMLFLSAAFVEQSIFKEGGIISSVVNNLPSQILLLAGLTFLTIGNGLFKTQIASMVGDLYERDDNRTESAYTLFYMGVNLGAFFAPIVCGIFESDWQNPTRFRWAFLIACIVMLLSVLVFLINKNKIKGPNGERIGGLPVIPKNKKEEVHTPIPVGRYLATTVTFIAMFAVFSIGAENFSDYISAAVFTSSIIIPFIVIIDKSLTRTERLRIGVIYIMVAFCIAFFAAYEQAGVSLTFLADGYADRTIGNWEMPSSWLQSINPVCVIFFAPLMTIMWRFLGKIGIEPSAIGKQAIGLILLSLGFAVIVYATDGLEGSSHISMFWLVAMYAMHSIGELASQPVGMSMVKRLSPARLSVMMMGIWYLSSASANIFAGKLSALYPEPGKEASQIFGYTISSISDFFLIFVIIAGIAGIILLCLAPWFNKIINTNEER